MEPYAARIPLELLKSSPFHKGEGWSSSYVDVGGKKIQKIHVIGTVIGKGESASGKFRSVQMDDSSSHISLRIFDEGLFSLWEGLAVGALARVIGNIREYNGEVYVVPTIIKPLESKEWIAVMRKQWKVQPKQSAAVEESISEKETEMEKEIAGTHIALIRSLDRGEGASVEEIMQQLGTDDPKKTLHDLISQGEVFEIRPGFVKVTF